MKAGRVGAMNSYRDKGERACRIVRSLWPMFRRTVSGGLEDKRGIDGYLNGKSVQVKYDERIVQSGNIYHEIYEKSAGNPSQEWRKSPGLVDGYIFVTRDRAFKLSVDELAQLEEGKSLRAISQTSMGFLIPIVDLPARSLCSLG